MTTTGTGTIVGVLGQWASGKTEAAKTLVEHLGTQGDVMLLTDRALFARQAIDYVLEREGTGVAVSFEDDGRQRLDTELVTIWLDPGEDLRTVDPNSLFFRMYDEEAIVAWRRRAKAQLGARIREESAAGRTVVVEAAFGSNKDASGDGQYGRTVHDLMARLESAGLEPWQVKWIIVEAGFEIRAARNESRPGNIPVKFFGEFGGDGGDLSPDQQKALEEQGTLIRRVSNDHDDVERFRADVVAAYDELCGGLRPRAIDAAGPG